MRTKEYSRYSYQSLLDAALDPDAEQIDIDTLGGWFMDFDPGAWNGMWYNIQEDGWAYKLIPVMDETGNELIRFDLR